MNDLSQLKPDTAWRTVDQHFKFDRRHAAHLFRRAGFGATSRELDEAVSNGMAKTIERLFDTSGDSQIDRQLKGIERLAVTSNQVRQLPNWWLMRMMQTPCPLLEKMTLFWHGHFATSAEKVTVPEAMLAQNRLLRQHALGRFDPMVKGISRDVAMLIYLDSTQNRKTRPNENYARELMELFCLGLDEYTEQDIKEVARCFTGWEVRRRKFRFNKYQHDEGVKSFLGKRGTFDGDDAVDIVLDQPAASRFIAWKLIRYFLVDEIDSSSPLVTHLAKSLKTSNFDIGKTVRTILTSHWFYSPHAIGQKIKSPVELALGVMRCIESTGNANEITTALNECGQLPFYPPNVKGWDGGRKWINASSMLGRANLVRGIANSENTLNDRGDLANWASRHSKRNSADIVQWLCEMMVAVEVDEQIKNSLVDVIESARRSKSRGIADAIAVIGTLPEFQLN